MNTIRSLLQILETTNNDTFDQMVSKWKDSVKKKHPNVASRLKFKSVDGGKRISAEVPGEDRCYGAFDLDKETGDVYEAVAHDKDVIEEDTRHITHGAMGEILVLDDGKLAKSLAKLLGVDDGWELTDVGQGLYAAYESGDRLTFYSDKRDYEPN